MHTLSEQLIGLALESFVQSALSACPAIPDHGV